MSKTTEFVNHVRSICKKTNTVFYLGAGKSIRNSDSGAAHEGFFQEESEPGVNRLHVATKFKREKWLSILVHEYAHLRQWLDDDPCWETGIAGWGDAYSLTDVWLDHDSEYPKPLINKAYRNIIACELDCEKRSVEIIKKYDLPISVPKYIKRASVCLLWYGVSKHFRKWHEYSDWYKKSSYPKLLRSVPSEFMELSEYYKPSEYYMKKFGKLGWRENADIQLCV